jgi:hypothetical protein
MRGGFFAALCLVFAAFATPACSKTANVVESRALTVDFGAYRTGVVEVDSKGIEGGEKASQDMLAYLEKKLKQQGILQPASIESGAQLIVRLRAAADNDSTADFRIVVDFLDARNHATLGQVTVTGNTRDDKAGAALRKIADEIVAYMTANRKSTAGAKAEPVASAPPAATSTAPAAGAVTKGTCTTTCAPDTSSALPSEDQKRIAEKVEPMLSAVRACLDHVSAQSIHPAAILRFEVSGQLSQLKIDAGGYDDLACVVDVRSRPPRIAVSRASMVRCDYRCQ